MTLEKGNVGIMSRGTRRGREEGTEGVICRGEGSEWEGEVTVVEWKKGR